MKIYVVKSFGPESGYMNLKSFVFEYDAIKYSEKIESQIPSDAEDEFVEIEELTLEQ
jgi:hypothetical protein